MKGQYIDKRYETSEHPQEHHIGFRILYDVEEWEDYCLRVADFKTVDYVTLDRCLEVASEYAKELANCPDNDPCRIRIVPILSFQKGDRKMKKGFDMSAGTVTLDLPQLKLVLGSAMCNARNELSRTEADIFNSIDQAVIAEHRGNSEENFVQLCHANTSREQLTHFANQYAEAIRAYFHVCEAIKREETVVQKGDESDA